MTVQIAAERPPARPAAPAGRRRLYVLDGLRLLAAAVVVASHWISVGALWPHGKEADAWGRPSVQVFPHAVWQASAYGFLGVELFFMISGFVICMSSWDRAPAAYARSRATRIFPMYWLSVLLTPLIFVFLPSLKVKESTGAFSDALANLTMVQDAFKVEDVNAVYWTLWIELRFYLLFALLVWWGLSYRRVLGFCGLWAVGALVAAQSGDGALQVVFQPVYAWFFIAGVGFYLVHRFGPTYLTCAMIFFSYLLGQQQVWPSAKAALAFTRWPNPPMWPVAAVIAAFFLVFALIAAGLFDRLRGRWLVTAGALTYPLYLLHYDLGFTAIAYLRDSVPPMPLVLGLFTAMLALCYLVHVLYERPVARRLGRAIDASVEAISRPDAKPETTEG